MWSFGSEGSLWHFCCCVLWAIICPKRHQSAGNVTWNYPQSPSALPSAWQFHRPLELQDNLGGDVGVHLHVCVWEREEITRVKRLTSNEMEVFPLKIKTDRWNPTNLLLSLLYLRSYNGLVWCKWSVSEGKLFSSSLTSFLTTHDGARFNVSLLCQTNLPLNVASRLCNQILELLLKVLINVIWDLMFAVYEVSLTPGLVPGLLCLPSVRLWGETYHQEQ